LEAPRPVDPAELEQKRLERLLRQFHEYLAAPAGRSWRKSVAKLCWLALLSVTAPAGSRYSDPRAQLDKRLLEESPDLFDFVDIAEAKVEG